jgi:hypothetical protein
MVIQAPRGHVALYLAVTVGCYISGGSGGGGGSSSDASISQFDTNCASCNSQCYNVPIRSSVAVVEAPHLFVFLFKS